ncbi:hypothetical protein [Stenotrophomonas sp. Iso1]|uniref:hypothetical protein n=1 Tax=Stenotrophomonas sp. Iso1 TaxID=2977283 RepID=UPI0022B7920A|nr:hypothetical protein [Stenotrophomonas sp. Iso1]
MRLRHLPEFRQTRRIPAFSGNAGYRFPVNKLNSLNFETLFSGPDVAAERKDDEVKRGGLMTLLQVFVPSMGEKFP